MAELARRRALAVLGMAPLLLVVALGVACSLTTSLDGLSGGVDDGGTIPSSDALGPGTDGSASGAESGSDASVAPDGAPPVPFCASLSPRPTFCDDFERDAPKGSWDEVAVNGGGRIVIDRSTRTAAGNELHASIPVFAAGGISLANLHRALVDAQQITLSYSLRIDAAPAQGQQQIMLVNVTPSDGTNDSFHTYLYVSSTGVTLAEETFPGAMGAMNTFKQTPLSAPIVFGTWQRIRMTLKLSTPPRVSLTVDGKTVFDEVADPFYRPGQAGVTAGIHYTNAPSGPLSLRVDDLTVDLQ